MVGTVVQRLRAATPATVAPVTGIRGARWPAVIAAMMVVAVGCSSSKHVTAPKLSGTTTTTTTTTPAATTIPPLPTPQPVSWKACDGNDGPQDFQCATLQVPLNYADPTGAKIGIALDRHQATGAKIGSLLTNPGGPGASGIDSLPYIVSLMPDSLLARFDVIGFDPRGVDRSDPVRCETGPQLDQWIHLNPAPTTEAGFEQLVAGAKTFAQGCEARSAALLPYVGTVNAARDMDEIRAAVGDPKLNYLGFSYGTYLGAIYAQMFPTHIRAMVLDGALNPALDPVTSDIDQAAAFDKELGDFFNYCSTSTICAWTPGGSLLAAYNALEAKVTAHPLLVPDTGGRSVGPGEFFYGVADELYDSASWPDLASALASAESGDGSLLLQASDDYTMRMADGAYSNELEANNAISCVDQPWPTSLATLQADAVLAKQKAPEFGVADLYGGLPCTMWPVPPTSQPMAVTAAGSPPIVVVGSTGDPATPYADAQALASQLQHGVLLTRVGDGHTGYSFSQCIRDNVDAYLLTLKVPAVGTSCPTP